VTAVSARYAVPLALLCALAALLVALHAYAGLRRDDCAHPEALIAGPGVSDPERRAQRDAWFREKFDAFAWREGAVRTPAGAPELYYAAVRSYDAKRLYYRPQYLLFREGTPERVELEWLEVDGQRVPVHRSFYAPPEPATAGGRRTPVVAHLLIYRGVPVDRPYLAQLRAAPALLLRGSAPMTLFYVQGSARPEELEPATRAALEWLAQAWRSYAATCRGR
jgi:hypothetical protein